MENVTLPASTRTPASRSARLQGAAATRAYLLAGKARVTLVSVRTGVRFTYRVAVKGDVAFVALLSGPNNDQDFAFLGTIFSETSYRHGRKSAIGESAPSAKAFAWVWAQLAAGELPESLEIWHEGRCGRCGRALTVPSSIASGLGPECAGKS